MKKNRKKVLVFLEQNKLLLKLKLTFVLSLVGFITLFASETYSQNKKFSINAEDVTVKEIFSEVENQSEFIFFYYDDIIDTDRRVSVKVKNLTVDKLLDILFESTDVTYQIIDRQIVITKKAPAHLAYSPPIAENPGAETLLIQPITITGRVTDASTGESMLGVNIVVQGTTTGTVTDLSGNYTINIPNKESILVFSFIGYVAKSVAVGDQKQISITLSADVAKLEEIVVVGYGMQKKESVVGAISQASGETIKQGVQGGDLGIALTGALPGLAVVRTSGRPGGLDYTTSGQDDFAYLYLRGQKTWNNSTPLVLVDGVERPLQNINPMEIEKISLLKDASATAVFGVKGANGVILITTLRGKEGKPKLSFESTVTKKTLSRFMHREGSYMGNLMKNYAILNEVPIREASWNYIVPNRYLELWKNHDYPEYLPDVDWVDELTKEWGTDTNVSMNLSGGTKVVKYFGSLAYLHEGDLFDLKDAGYGYAPNFQFDRMNFRSNLDFDITSTTRFSANVSGYFLLQKSPYNRGVANMYAMYNQPPDLYPVKYSDGVWGLNVTNVNYTNGIYQYSAQGMEVQKETRLNTDFLLNQKLDFITKGLSFNGKASYDNNFRSSGPALYGYGDLTKFISQSIVDEMYPGISADEIARLERKYTTWNVGTVSGNTGFDWVLPPNNYYNESASNASTYRNLYYELSMNYQRDFGKHSVSGLGLMSRQEQATGSEFKNFREDWVGRLTYGYDRRYNVEFNAAYNGSEKFSSKYRFGFFPSFGLGWTVSNESFFESLQSVVSNLKLRASQGIIGSDAGIERWLYVPSWIVRQNTTSTSSTDIFRFGTPYLQNAYPFRYQGVIPNPDIQWETAKKTDFGIETGFFQNQVRLSFDYYIEKRTNIYMSGSQITKPEYIGFSPVSANMGRVDAHGWEFELQFSKTFQNGLNIWLTHSWTYAIDKVIERGDPKYLPDYQKAAGYQIGQQRVNLNQSTRPILNWDGIYNTVQGTNNINVLPGNFAIVDFDGNGVIDTNDACPFGYPTRPQYTYAPSFGFEYKNFGFNMRWYGVYNIEGGLSTYRSNFANQYTLVYPQYRGWAWSPEFGLTDNATWPGVRFAAGGSSGYFDRSRAYLRLQHMEIHYTLSSSWIKKIGVTNLKFILSGDNVWLHSKMLEDLEAPQITTQGNVRSSYPTTRRVNFGLSFNFQ